MLFASLFAGYVMLRAGAVTWPDRFSGFPWLETLLLIGASAAFGATRFRLIASHALGLTFVVIRLATDASAIGSGLLPANNLMLASWYTLAWVHTFHVLAGAVFTGWLAGPSFAMAEDDGDRFWRAGLRPRAIMAVCRSRVAADRDWLLCVAVRPQEIPRLPPSRCALRRLRKPGL